MVIITFVLVMTYGFDIPLSINCFINSSSHLGHLLPVINQWFNADVNGSANIGRKVIENEDILLKLDRSVAATPERINPLKFFLRITVEECG
jgi:hypothetical protein